VFEVPAARGELVNKNLPFSIQKAYRKRVFLLTNSNRCLGHFNHKKRATLFFKPLFPVLELEL